MEFCGGGGSEVLQCLMAGRGGRGDSEQMRDFGLVFGRFLCRFYAFLAKIGSKSGPGDRFCVWVQALKLERMHASYLRKRSAKKSSPIAAQ